MNIDGKLAQLQCTFPKLTEANQHYVLGLAEGLKQAQNDRGKTELCRMEIKTLEVENERKS
jgi:hypothetical protein